MSEKKAVETKDKVAKIYLRMAIVFIVIFSTIYILWKFVSALNF
jgi:flagellar biogenesis protein FliO